MIQFKKVILHNFGSYGHVELDLQNRGFCLVSGQNNYVKDNALSNGSGKSFLWSAICYALTGVTIGGGGGSLGKWLDAKDGERFDMVGIPSKSIMSAFVCAAILLKYKESPTKSETSSISTF